MRSLTFKIIFISISLYTIFYFYKHEIEPKVLGYKQDLTTKVEEVKEVVIPKYDSQNYTDVEESPEEESVSNSDLESRFENGDAYYENSNMNSSDYNQLSDRLSGILSQYFSKKQLSCITRIHLINWQDLNNNIDGLTEGYDGGNSQIYLSIDNDCYIPTLVHEVWHAIHNKNMYLFNQKYKEDWDKINDYVTDYAQTNISEDVAETGMKFILDKDEYKYNPKINLIEQFYNETK